MNKRILIPTDFSKNALNAIRYAQELYKSLDCDFYFLNVYRGDGYALDSLMMVPEPGEPFYEAAKHESEEGLKILLEKLRLHPDNPKHSYHTISTFNSLLEAIDQSISKYDIDIVVMGTKGKTDATKISYGTNTISVMQEMTYCPVLVVPENVRFSPPKEIVFPTNFKTAFKYRELAYLIEIAKMHTCSVQVLYIDATDGLDRKQQENKELLIAIFDEIQYSFHSLKGVKVHEGINAFIESRDSDMIAFVNRKHSFFRDIFKKPLVKELGNNSQVPILKMNDR